MEGWFESAHNFMLDGWNPVMKLVDEWSNLWVQSFMGFTPRCLSETLSINSAREWQAVHPASVWRAAAVSHLRVEKIFHGFLCDIPIVSPFVPLWFRFVKGELYRGIPILQQRLDGVCRAPLLWLNLLRAYEWSFCAGTCGEGSDFCVGATRS